MKITKLTDYSLLLLCEMNYGELISAKQLSEKTNIPFATVNKLLRLLTNSNICFSKGGKLGGFGLSREHSNISILEVISCIEGLNTSFTTCSQNNMNCQLKKSCKISLKMKQIDNEIHNILKNKFLSDLI